MNSKAATIRARTAPVAPLPPRDDTFDADYNHKIFYELDNFQRKLRTESYLVIEEGCTDPCASIVVKHSDSQTTVIVTKFVNGRRVMFKGAARGYGYDRTTKAMDGFSLTNFARRKIVVNDNHKRWDSQLREEKFQIWRTL